MKICDNIEMPILPKMIYKFNAVPIRIPSDFIVEIEKLILKFTEKCKGLRLPKQSSKRAK